MTSRPPKKAAKTSENAITSNVRRAVLRRDGHVTLVSSMREALMYSMNGFVAEISGGRLINGQIKKSSWLCVK